MMKQNLQYELFFGESELPSLRRRFLEEPLFKSFRDSLAAVDRPAERQFLESEVNLRDPLQDLVRVTDLAEKMAFYFLMTGDEDAAELAKLSIRTLMRFPFWDFFLSGERVIGVQRASAATVAVSLVCDWLGSGLDPAERSEWIRVMGEKGCAPCYEGLWEIRYPRKAQIWYFNEETSFFDIRPGERSSMVRRPEITQRTNLRAVPAAALAIGTIAWKKECGDSPDGERWLEMATHSIEVFGDIYEEDGSYDEAINYANYTTLHIVQAVELFRRANWKDLSGLINWKGYAEYILNMTMPTADDAESIVNFGDSGNFPATSGSLKEKKRAATYRAAVPLWIARETGNGLAQWFALNRGGDMDIWSLLWFGPDTEVSVPPPGFQLWAGDLDWAVARTGWEAEDLVVALRSGPPANHEHADRNSIILKAFGEILVADPFRPPYSYNDPCWILRLTEGHSAVLVDGRGHGYHNGVEGTCASRAKARLVEKKELDGGYLLSSDGTQPYRLVDTRIKSVIRTLCIYPQESVVVILDYLEKYQGASSLEARFFGYHLDGECQLSADENGFLIKRPQALLQGTSFSSHSHKARVGQLPMPEEEAQKYPYAAVEVGAGEALLLVTVLCAARSEAELPRVSGKVDGLDFELAIGEISLRGTQIR